MKLFNSLVDYKNRILSRSQPADAIKGIFDSAMELHEKGELEQAGALYRKIIKSNPKHAESYYLLGVIAHQEQRDIDALRLIKQAIALYPDKPEFHSGCGEIYNALDDYKSAVGCFTAAVQLKSDFPAAYFNLGTAYRKLNNLDKALDCYKNVIELQPNMAEAHFQLGNILHEQGHNDSAISSYRKAIEINPDYAEAYNNLGTLYADMGQLSEALDCYEKVLLLNPNIAEVQNNLANMYKDTGQYKKAMEHYEKAISLDPDYTQAHSNLLLCMHYPEDVTQEEIVAAHINWARQHARQIAEKSVPCLNDFTSDRRIRIGYVSPDFHTHSVARFIEPILAHHDREKFEIYAYNDSAFYDDITNRLKSFTEHWRDTNGMSDADLARLIREDTIDILVDLSGHTARNRLLVFARSPAPVQVTYLGYPATTGLDQIKYRLTDAWADPPGMTEKYHTETLIRLPHGFLCYQPPAGDIDISELPSLKNSSVTFACFNSFTKVNHELIKLWSTIINNTPGSTLLLKSAQFRDSKFCETVKNLFEQLGIPSSRLELIGWIESFEKHMALYNRIDIALDTHPYNGTTTTCEALWMGVPVITRAGNSHHSRVGTSILSRVGLAECIAETADDYVATAVALANDTEKLSALRNTMRDRIRNTSLIDAELFTHSLEEAYTAMWENQCASGKSH